MGHFGPRQRAPAGGAPPQPRPRRGWGRGGGAAIAGERNRGWNRQSAQLGEEIRNVEKEWGVGGEDLSVGGGFGVTGKSWGSGEDLGQGRELEY